MPIDTLELGPFTDGVNLVDPITKLLPSELSECRNWRTGVRGEFNKRPGHKNYGSSPAKVNGDNLVTLALRYYRADGTKKLIAAAGGKLKFGNDSTGAWTQIDIDGVAGNNMSTTNLADWMVYKNRLYITDGVKPQRYNNTDNIYAGHFIHAAPTLAQPSAGSIPNGTYKYFVTSVAGDMGEGPAGAVATITVTGGPKQVDLSAMAAAAAKHEETVKRIYRTKVGGSLYYLLAEIPSATTTFTDNTLDTALGLEHVPTHIPPADARFVLVGHDDRTYWFGRSGLNASLVDVSEVGWPDRIRDVDNFAVANNDGDIVTGGGLVPGGIIFFKKNTMWLLRAFGFGLINIRPKDRRGTGIGTTSPLSVVSTPVGLIFLSQRGEVYRFDGTNIEEIGRKIATEFIGMPQSSMGLVVACYHDYRYQISYDFKGQKGYNSRTLEYDIRTGKWEGPHENTTLYTPSYYSVWDSVLDKGELAWGESRAAGGSFVYIRDEFSKTDRGNRFLSRARTGARVNKLGEIKTIKAFVHGEFSASASLSISHINEKSEKTTVPLTSPNPVIGGIYNVSKYNQSKYAGQVLEVLEGSFSNQTTAARSRIPQYELSDDATADSAKLTVLELLVDVLQPK